MDGLLLPHVEDILFTGPEKPIRHVNRDMEKLRAGDLEILTEKTPIIATGLLTERNQQGDAILSQEHYIKELQTMNIDNCIEDVKI